MKSKIVTWITGAGLLALLSISARMMVQEESARHPHAPRQYKVIGLGKLGGPGTNTSAFQLNNGGRVGGLSNLVASGPNASGEAAVGSETSMLDPATCRSRKTSSADPVRVLQIRGQVKLRASVPFSSQ